MHGILATTLCLGKWSVHRGRFPRWRAPGTVLLAVLVWCLSPATPAFSTDIGDIEVGVYALGSWPRDQDIYNQGTTVPASIQAGGGAGLKVGFYPSLLSRMVGLQLDSNIHSTAIAFPNIARGGHHDTARSDLLVTNTIFHLILRYPGTRFRPYIGAGIGWSSGTLLNPNIAGREDRDFASAIAFTHQFLGGAQLVIKPDIPIFDTQHTMAIFLFSEYRYVSANYHWEGLALDFRTHYGLLGVGVRF